LRSHRSNVTASVAVTMMSALLVAALLPGLALGKPAASAYSTGFESFEPTLGTTSNGDIYFSITPTSGVAAGWDASIAKSTDGGKSWKDVGPRLPTGHSMPPETNDPYIYVDPSTDRVFTFHMAPILLCANLSYSDDGGKTWQNNPNGCSPTAVYDHQTIVAAKPRETATNGYPNILHQCVNAIYAAMCATSTDGGFSWGPATPVYPKPEPTQTCGAQHGHLAAGPDGHVFLPTSLCGTFPTVFISGDDGKTWRESRIAEIETPFVDPTVSVDSKGNLYASFIDERGFLYFTTSTNNGKKWAKPIQAAGGYTANMPVIVAGDPGKVAIAYPATNDLAKGYDTEGYLDGSEAEVAKKVDWGANFTVSFNALAPKPKFKTVVSTGKDPLGRGRICVRGTRCDYLIDFIEAVIGPDGRPYASFSDGCLELCVKGEGPNKSGTGVGVLTTLQTGPKLCSSTCWRYKPAGKGQMNLAEALLFAGTPKQQASSSAHGRVPLGLQLLRDQATQRRLDAVGR